MVTKKIKNCEQNKKYALSIYLYENIVDEKFDKSNDFCLDRIEIILKRIEQLDENTFEFKNYNYNHELVENEKYLVFDDENKLNDYFKNYIIRYIEKMLEGVPEKFQMYFDWKKFYKDSLQIKGEYLATFDGKENIIEYENNKYFIYRIN